MMKRLLFFCLCLLMGIFRGYSQDGSSALPDVWDFGATQLDETQFNNQLSVEIINSWYDPSITPGTSGHNLPDFTVGDLSFVGGGSDRLRTTNTALTRYDENIDDYSEFKGRIYINSSGATDRYFSLDLEAYDEVTIWALSQNGSGNIHFENVSVTGGQNDVTAVGETLTELRFTANQSGTFHIYDDTDKPSYFRIVRQSAIYATIDGNVDLSAAADIPAEFKVIFTNENGNSWSSAVSGGAFSVDLPVGYNYNVSLEGADGYSISGTPNLEVTENTSSFDISITKLTDVWDFGAAQLDETQFNNQLSVEIINSWYDPSITPGTFGHNLPDFTAGDLSFVGGGSDRLRTSNTDLTRYDENINDYVDFKGKVYINSRGATDRYFSLDLDEDDEVTIWALGQDGNGNIHFEYVADPSLQNDIAGTGTEPSELNFVAKATGTYHIYDDTDKASYFRIVRKSATYVSVSGNVDITNASGIPSGYNVVFTNSNGKTWTSGVSNGTYSVDLPVGHEYDVSLEGADGFSIFTVSTLDVTDSTSTFNIAVNDGSSTNDGLSDVWDFGATQLDASQYDNQLTVEVINSWYDASITPGSSGNNLPDFTVGDLSFTGGGSDRLRTSNLALTRYDENIDEYEDFKGRVYINSSGATDRYFSLELKEDDEVIIWALTQNGTGNIHFEYVADPDLQNEVVAVGEELTELTFVAKAAGTYHIYDDTDKPSYFRIVRESATYAAISGNVDVTDASGIPADYNIVFTNDIGKTWTAAVSGGSYAVNLPVGHQYDISLEGADGFTLASSTTLDVTTNTSSNDIVVKEEGASIAGLPDVWDFGATQLDPTEYNNKLNVDIINSWYDPSITPGSSGNVLPDFTAGDLSWTGGGNDRLRTVNTDLTRYDENIDDYEDFKGRVYVNSRGAEDRYFSLELNEDDKVSLWVLGQDGNGELHFVYVADPELQDEVVMTSGELTQVNFVAKASGTYHIYDGADKPSYFRIMRDPATYATLTGNIDLTEAPGIPANYSLVFSIAEGKTWIVNPVDGQYQVELPVGFDYTIEVEGADGYIITNGASLNLTESTSNYDLTIEKVEIYSVSGSITGLGDKIGELNLTFTANSSEAVYIPKPIVDIDAGTYTVKLEPNITYTINGGVDGYYIPDNQLEITGEATQDIVFAPVPDGPYGDVDEDGVLNSEDNCMYTPNADQADSDGNGIGDVCEDDDGDGVINFEDNCPDTPEGVTVDVFGCEVFDLAADNYGITAHSVSCNGNGDGFISISAKDSGYTYNVAVTGVDNGSATLSSSNDFSADVEDLSAGTYNVCVTVDGRDDYQQCFRVTIDGPTPLSAYSSVNYANNKMSLSLDGAERYTIDLNGQVTTTTQSKVVLDLKTGMNKILVSTDSSCQGVFYDEVFLSENVVLYPNPTKGYLKAYINGTDKSINVSLINSHGQEFMSGEMTVPSDRMLELNMSNLRDGVYFLVLKSSTVKRTLKVIKS